MADDYKDSSDMNDDDLLAEGKAAFKRANDAESDNRDEALDDLRFARLGEQWPEAIKRKRELEGRPCLTNNKLPAFIRQVVNDARQNKPSIQIHPVDSGADVETAEVMSGLIRNIEYASNADVAYDTGIESAVSMGFGYWRVDTEYSYDDTFEQDIRILRVANPFTVYGDPDSTAADSSDWNTAFITDLMPLKEFKRKYPDAQKTSFAADSDDLDTLWKEGDMIRVAEWWKKEEVPAKLVGLSDGSAIFEDEYEANKDIYEAMGLEIVSSRMSRRCKVTQRIMSGAEILETNAWAGKYIPIIPVYGDEVNVEGKRHFLSLIRFAKDPQRMHNYWRTTSTELVALAPKAPFVGPVGAFDTDADKWETANTDSHAFLEYDGPVPPQRQPFAGVPAGAMQEALNAADDMKAVMGLYDASIGARSNETSGRAILARQREGDVSTFHFIDNNTRAIRHTGKILIDLIPKIYSKERIVRILGEDGSQDEIKINAEYQDKTGAVKLHDLAIGKYDLTVTSGPSFTTKREEAAAQMMELLRAFPQAAPFIGDLIAKNLDWPGAEEIAKRLKIMLPPQLQEDQQSQIPPQVQQMIEQGKQQMQQMQQAIQQLQAENQQLQQEKQSKQAEYALKQQDMARQAQSDQAEFMYKQQDLDLKAQIERMSFEITSRELDIREKELQLKELEIKMKSMQVADNAIQAASQTIPDIIVTEE